MKYNLMSKTYSLQELVDICTLYRATDIVTYSNINVISASSDLDLINAMSNYDIVIEENSIAVPCELKTQPIDNNWGLRILTNSIADNSLVLSGFSVLYKSTNIINTSLINCSYSINNILELQAGKNHIYIDKSYYIETKKPLAIANCLGYTNGSYASVYDINTTLYIQYNYSLDSWLVRHTVESGYIALYSVEVELINNSDALLASKGSVLYQFTNLKPIGPLENSYKYASSGNNVAVVVGDSQLNTTRIDEFNDRIKLIYNPYSTLYTDEFLDPFYCSDYHGMAVASCIAGNTCGVAKNATIYGITCLDITEEYGNRSDQVIDGLNAIYSFVVSCKNLKQPVIVCLAFTIASNSIINEIIKNIVALGTLVITPIGDIDSSSGSPYHSNALCVGSINSSISISGTSRYGALVNIWAPGDSVSVASHEYGIYLTKTGTSFAAAYTTGICSLYLSLFPEATPAQVKNAILDNARNSLVYPKDDCTSKILAPVLYSEVVTSNIKTPILAYNSLYTYIPFIVMVDGTRVYLDSIEVSISKIGTSLISAARLESINLATKLNLVG